MSQSFKLFRLQGIDSQIDRIQARLGEIQTALQNDEAVLQAQERFAAAEQASSASRKELRLAEEETQANRIKIETSESNLYGGRIRNPKELQDLQKEIAALKRHRATLEDRQLEAMMSLEEVEKEHTDAKHALDLERARFAATHNKLKLEAAELDKEQERLNSERQAAISSIPQNDMDLYDQLRIRRQGVAVARITNQACSACGSVLNSALLSAAFSPNQLSRCDHCGRILHAG